MVEVEEFSKRYLDDAVDLFARSYKEQRRKLPLIPERTNIYESVRAALSDDIHRPGVMVFEDGELVGYMIETAVAEDFMGEKTAFSLGLFSHSSIVRGRERLYQKMYSRLSEIWVENGYHSHIFSIWAQDEVVLQTFFRLGFGMTHFELMRDLSLPDMGEKKFEIKRVDDMGTLEELMEREREYYPKAPLFWIPPEGGERDEDVQTITAFDDDKAVAYMDLKLNEAETALLADEDTVRIAGAFVDDDYRDMGIGTLLLREAVKWAKERSLKRMYVEGESANVQGGNFWMKHFTPVVYTVRRCVDRRV